MSNKQELPSTYHPHHLNNLVKEHQPPHSHAVLLGLKYAPDLPDSMTSLSEPAWLNLTNAKNIHLNGPVSSGKSFLTSAMLISASRFNHPKDFQFFHLGAASYPDVSALVSLPHGIPNGIHCDIHQHPDKFLQAIERAVKLVDHRRSEPNPHPHVILSLDGFEEILTYMDGMQHPTYTSVPEMLGYILQNGPAHGIHTLITTYPEFTVPDWLSKLKESFSHTLTSTRDQRGDISQPGEFSVLDMSSHQSYTFRAPLLTNIQPNPPEDTAILP